MEFSTISSYLDISVCLRLADALCSEGNLERHPWMGRLASYVITLSVVSVMGRIPALVGELW